MSDKKKVPVGATWIAENRRGKLTIWLEQRRGKLEVWRWSFQNPDGSTPSGWDSGDWAPSYRLCREECYYKIVLNDKVPRFRRIITAGKA